MVAGMRKVAWIRRLGSPTGKEIIMLKVLYAIVLSVGIVAALAATPLPNQSAAAQTAAPDAKPADKKTAKPKKPPSPGQIAARERQKKCGEEWKAAKAAGKIEKGMKWPQYWSACNKRLKSGG
jgi:hypothetical protein